MTEQVTAREQLGRDLKYLRESAGLSERVLAKRLGINQSTVQRMEKAKGITAVSVHPNLVIRWAAETGASVSMRTRLQVLVEAILREDPSWRDRLGDDRSHLQDEIREREASAHTVRNFQPTVVPGLLQTPEYGRYVIPLADVEGSFGHEASLVARLERQQELFTGRRQFEFLIREGVLRWPRSQPEMVAAQLDRITTLAQLKSVTVAVLPLGEPVDAVPWSNFVIFEGGDPLVTVEILHREDVVTEPHRIDLYRSLYSKMWSRAATGGDGMELIQRVAAELRVV